jgi:aminobenzoyl-glutamate transport protein
MEPTSRTGEAPKILLQKLLDVVERVGNKVPHPTVLFFLLIGLISRYFRGGGKK